jgi:hypothetical protein
MNGRAERPPGEITRRVSPKLGQFLRSLSGVRVPNTRNQNPEDDDACDRALADADSGHGDLLGEVRGGDGAVGVAGRAGLELGGAECLAERLG